MSMTKFQLKLGGDEGCVAVCCSVLSLLQCVAVFGCFLPDWYLLQRHPHTHKHAHTHAHTHTYTHTHTYAHIHTHTPTHTHAHVRTCARTHTHTHVARGLTHTQRKTHNEKRNQSVMNADKYWGMNQWWMQTSIVEWITTLCRGKEGMRSVERILSPRIHLYLFKYSCGTNYCFFYSSLSGPLSTWDSQ